MLDLHVDFIIQKRLFGYDPVRAHRPWLRGQPWFNHADLPRMHQAEYVGACLGVHYLPFEREAGWREAKRQIAAIDAITEASPLARRVRTPGEWRAAIDDGVMAIAPGVEGAHMLNKDLSRVEELRDLGVAYLTLAHLGPNSAASNGYGIRSNATKGLTELGRDLVAELERCDILVDLAHVNTPGVLDACARATKPLMCTHTGCRSLHQHKRLLTDEELDAVAETGGVVGIIFAPTFLTGRLRATSACVVDHIEYALDRLGPAHVAIGSDFDGWLPSIPSDMRDCTGAHRVLDELRRRGHGEQVVEGVAWRNALRVLTRAPLT